MNTTTAIALEGTEKQINWAQTIRDQKLEFVKSRLADAGIESAKAVEYLASQSSAKFWIENRDSSSLALGVFAAGSTGTKLSTESFPVQDRLIAKEKIDGEWVEKSRSEYVSEAIAIRFKSRPLDLKFGDAVWVCLNIETGKLSFGTGDKPEGENLNVYSLAKVLSFANCTGWAMQDYKFALIRHHAGNWKVDFVKAVK
jgi:hypothetical protein